MDTAFATIIGALIGAGAALVGQIMAGIFSYLANRESVRTKRFEIAFEERLEALNEVLQTMGEMNNRIENFQRIWKYYDDLYVVLEIPLREREDKHKTAFFSCPEDFLETYNRNRLYLPIEVDNEVRKYVDTVLDMPRVYREEFPDEPDRPPDLLPEPTQRSFEEYFERVTPAKETILESTAAKMQQYLYLS